MRHGMGRRLLAFLAAMMLMGNTALAYEKLQRGASGLQVLTMQQALSSLGFSIDTDGKYGPATQRVVKAFQQKYGLKVDGVAGNQTLGLLYSLAPGSGAQTAAPAQNTAAMPEPSGVTATVSTPGGSLNLREKASGSARILTTIPQGGKVQVVNRGSAWCSVWYGGMAGWVMTKFLSFGNAAAPTAAPSTPAPAGEMQAQVVTPGGSLNLREQANGNARVLTTVPQYAFLTVTARGDAWCAVRYGGINGYVMSRYLRFDGAFVLPTAVPTAAPTAVPTAVPTAAPAAAPTAAPVQTGLGTAIVATSGGTLNLREAPGENARVIAEMPNGSAVTVTSRGDTWCGVIYQGQAGFAMTKFVTVLGETQTKQNTDREEDPSAYTRTLRKGMTGADVTWVQTRLQALGYGAAETGVYDDATFEAVRRFQSQNALTADGLAGQQTFTALKSASARRADAAPLSYETLRIDDTGDGVRQLQTDLKALGYPVAVNGTYGESTHNAVVAFQQRNGLTISGIADPLTRQAVHGGGGKPYSTPVEELPADAGKMAAPAVSEMKLLHWVNDIKPAVRAGQAFTVYDPNSGLGWTLVFYSLGRHADSQPATWRDTQIMNRAFGATNWNIHPVYVKLPSGQWTVATMHNRPHLYGSITDNGFGGHLCVHFLRDMAEAQKNDPNYGVNNQVTLRNTWKALTGETVN